MSDETILTWSFANMITVTLMVLVGMALLGLGVRAYQSRNAG